MRDHPGSFQPAAVAMRKFLLPALFVLLLCLNIAGYFLLVFDLDGSKIETGDGPMSVAQNDRMVVVLTLEGEHTGGRVLLVDRLPAGLEIENPRLVESGDIKSLAWLHTAGKPTHTEFRDDRFVASFDYFQGEDRRSGAKPTATVAYIVRAVTPGRYVHPAAAVEDMYRPDLFARTGAGQLVVTAVQ